MIVEQIDEVISGPFRRGVLSHAHALTLAIEFRSVINYTCKSNF